MNHKRGEIESQQKCNDFNFIDRLGITIQGQLFERMNFSFFADWYLR